MAQAKPKVKPVQELRMGRIKATIWANGTPAGLRHNVTFTRVFKTEAGWEASARFGRDDLPLLIKVADQAHAWIYGNGARPADDRPDTEETDTATAQARDEIPF